MASYRVDVSGDACIEIRRSPGNIRQRIIRALRLLEAEPRPPESRPLDLEKASVDLAPGAELRRIRLESWRLVYLIEEDVRLVTVLAIRKRPRYQCDDLEELLKHSD